MKFVLMMILLVLGASVAVSLVLISGWLNYVFGFDMTDSPVIAWMAAGLDGLKAVIPVVIAVGSVAGIVFSKGGLRLAYFFFAIISWMATFQIITGNRIDQAALKSDDQQQISDIDSSRKDLVAERDKISKLRTRSKSEVKRHYESRCHSKRRKKWGSCKALARELGRAERLFDITSELKELKGDRKGYKVLGSIDSAAFSIQKATGLTIDQVYLILGVLIATGLELGTGFVPAPVFAVMIALADTKGKGGVGVGVGGPSKQIVAADSFVDAQATVEVEPVELEFVPVRGDGLGDAARSGQDAAVLQVDDEARRVGELRDGLRRAGYSSEVKIYFAICIDVTGDPRAIPAQIIYDDYLKWQQVRPGDVVPKGEFVRLFGEGLAKQLQGRDVVGSEIVDGGEVTVFKHVTIKLRVIEQSA